MFGSQISTQRNNQSIDMSKISFVHEWLATHVLILMFSSRVKVETKKIYERQFANAMNRN